MNKGQQVTDQEIESSLNSLARLIDRYGDAYWPIFERLGQELKVRQERRIRVSTYLQEYRTALHSLR